MENSRLVWFLLVDEDGNAYKKAMAHYVFIPKDFVVAQFKDEVTKKNPNVLAGVDALPFTRNLADNLDIVGSTRCPSTAFTPVYCTPSGATSTISLSRNGKINADVETLGYQEHQESANPSSLFTYCIAWLVRNPLSSQKELSITQPPISESLTDTFYIIDGKDPIPVPSSCVAMYIASPRSDNYKEFVKQTNARQWFLPVWTLDELEACRERCYHDFGIDTLHEQYRIYGGAARSVFKSNGPEDMEACMADVDAIKGVRNVGSPTRIFPTAHMLLHVIVSDDGNYRFQHVDIASKYVGEQLWKKHAAQMVINLTEMFGGSPNEISRHLFEIYGHLVFSQGGRTLKCRNLDNGSISNLCLDLLDGKRESFTRNSIPKKPITRYYEPSDDDTFPAIDSLSPQGMFQFTVGTEHPIRGVRTLQQVCDAFDTPYKLYFVVPPHRFEKFGKQPYKETKGSGVVNPIQGLEQYVLELVVV